MKHSIWIFLSIFLLFTHAKAEDSFYMGDPQSLRTEAHSTVLNKFPNAELWLIQNYSREHWDEGCSQFGWVYIFIGTENGFEKDIRIKFDHSKQVDGSCKYIARINLEIEPNQITGIQPLKMENVLVGYEDALDYAKKVVNLPFKVWWAKLITPLHPASKGRVFWNFKGPVKCNKGAELTIDASTGQLEPLFSTIPNCP